MAGRGCGRGACRVFVRVCAVCAHALRVRAKMALTIMVNDIVGHRVYVADGFPVEDKAWISGLVLFAKVVYDIVLVVGHVELQHPPRPLHRRGTPTASMYMVRNRVGFFQGVPNMQ